jgi:hypothetical protein
MTKNENLNLHGVQFHVEFFHGRWYAWSDAEPETVYGSASRERAIERAIHGVVNPSLN